MKDPAVEEMKNRAEKAKELASRATEGPWEFRYCHESGCDYPEVDCSGCGYIKIWTERNKTVVGYEGLESENNADFITEARTLVPDLADMVLALCEVIRVKDEALKDMIESYDLTAEHGSPLMKNVLYGYFLNIEQNRKALAIQPEIKK